MKGKDKTVSAPFEKGRKLGQYEILGPLGKGGMASVYRANQPSLEREVAIKIMAEQFATDPSFVERFRREARSIARLRHPNILTVYDAGEDNGLLYMVMELVDGPTLKDEINGQPLPVDKAIGYISQVAGALDYANKNGIIHRDVKPSNVLLEKNGRAVLADFGIAKLAEQSNQLTSTGTGVGTPDYMSPEQALGEGLDARSDQYSLGVMLYELLTGRPPFAGDTPIAVVMGHVSKPLPSPRQFNPQIPESVEAVVTKALSKKAVDRYESSAAFSEALQEAWRNRKVAPVASAEPDNMAEPTVAVGYVPRLETGSYNPEAERLYSEARHLEQQNNFNNAFVVFNQLETRFPRYRDVPGILDRYRTMGYGQAQTTGWQAVQNNPAASGQYGSYAGNSASGPYNTAYTGQPANRQYTPPPTAARPMPGNQATGAYPGSGYYLPGSQAGQIAPAKKSFPVIPVAVAIVGLALAAIALIIMLVGSGGNKSPTATAGVAANSTVAPSTTVAAAATTIKSTSVAATTALQPSSVAAITTLRPTSTSAARPTTAPGAASPRPTITIQLPTPRPPVTPAITSVAGAGSTKYLTYKQPDGLWTAEVPDDWEAEDDAGTITFTSKNDSTTSLVVLSEEIPAGNDATNQALVEIIVKQYLESYGAKIQKEEKRKVDGIDTTLYLGTFDSSGITLDMKLISVSKKDRLYLVLLAALPNSSGTSDKAFDRFLTTIKFK